MARHLDLGADGESVAAHHYARLGFEVEARNWRCPDGELDIVARRGGLLVFCEVKTRRSERFGGGAVAVDRRRQSRLRAAALRYLEGHPRARSLRFDVAVVTPGPHGFAVEVIEAAF